MQLDLSGQGGRRSWLRVEDLGRGQTMQRLGAQDPHSFITQSSLGPHFLLSSWTALIRGNPYPKLH